MNEEALTQIGVMLVFALVLMLLNLKAGSTWLKFVTLWTMLAALGAAGYIAVTQVLL